MGQNFSVEAKQSAQQKLQFVQLFEDANFGSIQIFRFKEPPYEYIMDYRKSFVELDSRIQYYCEFIKSLQGMQHKNLAKIHLFEIKEENHMCIKDKKTHVYCNYYNFTLAQAIVKKKKTSSLFPQNDLLYIMGCLVSLASYLKQFKMFLGQYRADRVYISPQGYIKMYLLEFQKEDKHNCYYKVLQEMSKIEQFILAPQQLKYLNQMEYELKFDLQKADLFAIGMLILQLLTLDHPKFYYQQGYTGIKEGKIDFSLETYRKTYSQRFIRLMKGCLNADAKKRPTFQQANHQIEQCKKQLSSMSFCIRLQDDEDNLSKKKQNAQISSSKNPFSSFPSGLQKRLTATPISTISHQYNAKITSPLTTLASTTSSNYKPVGIYNSKYGSKRQSFNNQGQKVGYMPVHIRSGQFEAFGNKQKTNK